MATKLTKAYIQYSKKMTTALLIFWAVIRLASVILVAVNPYCGTSMIGIVRGVDDISMVVVCSYTINSLGEKTVTQFGKGYFKARAKEQIKEDEEEDDESSNG